MAKYVDAGFFFPTKWVAPREVGFVYIHDGDKKIQLPSFERISRGCAHNALKDGVREPIISGELSVFEVIKALSIVPQSWIDVWQSELGDSFRPLVAGSHYIFKEFFDDMERARISDEDKARLLVASARYTDQFVGMARELARAVRKAADFEAHLQPFAFLLSQRRYDSDTINEWAKHDIALALRLKAAGISDERIPVLAQNGIDPSLAGVLARTVNA
jgi:hypothetical protein